MGFLQQLESKQASVGPVACCQYCEVCENGPCHLSLPGDCPPHACSAQPLNGLPARLVRWNRGTEKVFGLCFKELRRLTPAVNSLVVG